MADATDVNAGFGPGIEVDCPPGSEGTVIYYDGSTVGINPVIFYSDAAKGEFWLEVQ